MDFRTLIARGQWVLRREGARLRWRGLIGVALIALAIGLALGVLRPAADRTDALEADVAALRARLKSAGEGGHSPSVAPTRAAQLANFYAFFPVPATLPDSVGQIHNAAQRAGLVLESGEYQMQHVPSERLVRYQVRLPVRGTYPQLRAFVAEVLSKVPSASLDDVLVKREGIGAPELDAKFTFTLFFGGGT